MLIPKRTNTERGQQNAKNVPIKITGFTTHSYTDKNGKLVTNDAIAGINMETKKAVIVSLTVNGKYAEKKNEKGELVRPSIKQAKDFTSGGKRYKLMENDIIVASHASIVGKTDKEEDVLSAGWIDYITLNGGKIGQDRVLDIPSIGIAQYYPAYARTGSKANGFVDVLDYAGKASAKPNELSSAITAIVKSKGDDSANISFMVRALDVSGNVIGATLPLQANFKRVDEKGNEVTGGAGVSARRSPEEVGVKIDSSVKKDSGMQLASQPASYEIIPGIRFKAGKSLTNIESIAKTFVVKHDAGTEVVAKKIVVRHGAKGIDEWNKPYDYTGFVDRLNVIDPWGPGIDPALYNGHDAPPLLYSDELQQIIDDARNSGVADNNEQRVSQPNNNHATPSAYENGDPGPGFSSNDDPLAAFDHGFDDDIEDIPGLN